MCFIITVISALSYSAIFKSDLIVCVVNLLSDGNQWGFDEREQGEFPGQAEHQIQDTDTLDQAAQEDVHIHRH